MSNGDQKTCESVRNVLNENKINFSEGDIQHATKFDCRSGAHKCGLIVYSSGKLVVQGGSSALNDWLVTVKAAIEAGNAAPGALLPAEIEKFPQTLRERVVACDDVVMWFFQEALKCYKAGSISGAAFMLGAASEKAINLLVEKYAECIDDQKNQDRFKTRVGNRAISFKYDEFKKSYSASKSRPKEGILAQDLDILLDGAFNFYRHTRNSVGHPQMIPDLDSGVVLANLGQFITYIERIYCLMDHLEKERVSL